MECYVRVVEDIGSHIDKDDNQATDDKEKYDSACSCSVVIFRPVESKLRDTENVH